MSPEKATAFAYRCEKAWLSLVAAGDEREAVAWGQVVDALFADQPLLAIRRAEQYDLPASTIVAIRDAFDIV